MWPVELKLAFAPELHTESENTPSKWNSALKTSEEGQSREKLHFNVSKWCGSICDTKNAFQNWLKYPN